ncbi:ribosome biogenesis protein Nop53/GLTSCR2 [Neohortaea acidophila]|uniref:Ribosome biogenesis protein NOP53 n=1 Tax=Neohortaea acidophila TaxID=245834 RepID=A0A6A6PUY3_9PEZI|nr:ribosome biogenesis protein Nop53/GLTSCR2 [Neohortaea acidophila]KAF2483057.1 ribosome biogenesis protein Nop53/GLTSCR2 [Neohortaea acidophila]
MAQEPAPTAPATHTQSSRKGKRAWRKNIDLTAVQSGLEDLQSAKIAHGNVLPAEKDASELFATDTVGDEDFAKKQQVGRKLLKAEEILAMRSAVPGLDGRKRKADDKVAAPRLGKKAKNGAYVSHKELQRLRAVADGKTGGVPAGEEGATHDPWDDEPVAEAPEFDFIRFAQPKKKREPKTLKHAPKPLTKSGKHIPNVVRPNAGKSYNPLIGDWSALLEREGAAAVEAEQKRLAAEAEAEAREARAAEEAAKVEAAERDVYATDYDSAWESEWDGFISGGEKEQQEVWTQKQKARKTQAERNKVKARKAREAQAMHEEKVKARVKEEARIAQIAAELSVKDKAKHAHARALQQEHSSDSEAEDVQLHRPRFGKVAVPEAPLEVVLPEDLQDSLRRLKPEGDLMQERYRNLLVNGKLEMRKRAGERKKPKVTRGEKWSYKDWQLR